VCKEKLSGGGRRIEERRRNQAKRLHMFKIDSGDKQVLHMGLLGGAKPLHS